MPKNFHYRLIRLKDHNFYIRNTIRPLHIRIKEHPNTHAFLFHKHLIKYKNNDNNFSIKTEAIERNVGNLRINEALLLARLHPQINSAGHCWRNKDELINEIVLWAPAHGRAKAGRTARTYLQQLCADSGWSLKDIPGAIDDRDGWREKIRNWTSYIMFIY